MQHKTAMWLLVGAIVLVGVVLLVRRESPEPTRPIPSTATTTSATSTETTDASTTAVDLGNGMIAHLPAGVHLTEVPVASSVQAPNLDHPVNYSTDLSPDVVATLTKDIASTTASLKRNPSQADVWLQLAVYYKIAGDFHAAEAIWTYLTKAAPSNYVAFADLGDLYQNFLQNYPQAETNYLQAIKLKPDAVYVYANLYSLYKYQYKTNTTAAADILAQGLKANPGNPDLLELQKQQ